MADDGRVLTTKLPHQLVTHLDEVAARIGRSKSWIARQALKEWLAEEQRRYDLTLDAIASVDAGLAISHEEFVASLRRTLPTARPRVEDRQP